MIRGPIVFVPYYMKRVWSFRDLLWWIAFRARPIDFDEDDKLNLAVSIRYEAKSRNRDPSQNGDWPKYEERPQYQDYRHLLSICVDGPDVFDKDIYEGLKNAQDIYSKLHHSYEPLVRKAYAKLAPLLQSGEIVFMQEASDPYGETREITPRMWEECGLKVRGINTNFTSLEFINSIFLDLNNIDQETKIFNLFPKPEIYYPPKDLIFSGSSLILDSEIEVDPSTKVLRLETRGPKPFYNRDEVYEKVAEIIFRENGTLPSESTVIKEVCQMLTDKYDKELAISRVQDILKPFYRAWKKHKAL